MRVDVAGMIERRRGISALLRDRSARLWSGLFVVLMLVSAACSGRFDPLQYPSPEALFEASLEKYNNGDCGSAEIGFQRLSFELPVRDPRRGEARFYLAECLHESKRYLEANREYRRVADQHAQDSLAPMALLRMAEAYTKLWRRVELDATYGLSALTVLQELIQRYPSSTSAQQGRAYLQELNENFAHKEFKTGVYYFRAKAFDSAIIYFRIGYEEDRNDMCGQLERFYPDILAQAKACLSDTSSVSLNR